jgi:DNA repair exonuclease SbcCD nuclease subunit
MSRFASCRSWLLPGLLFVGAALSGCSDGGPSASPTDAATLADADGGVLTAVDAMAFTDAPVSVDGEPAVDTATGIDGPATGIDGAATGIDGAAAAVRLLVLSDPHYYDPALGTTGSAFAAYTARDRKLIAESDAIMRDMVTAVEAEAPQVVLISGDLTKDGEQSSHNRVAGYLHQMMSGGRKVFVVPGNHDIQNDGAQGYAGDVATPVPTISAAEFATIYNDMGYGQAMARDPGSLSYVAEMAPDLWLLGIDSCIYGEVRAPETTPGRITDATKAWIQVQLALAASRGARVLAMMHHGVVEHFANQALVFPEYVVDERDAVAALLSNGGVGAVFTGHFHANDITRGLPSGSARAIYDIETGSTVTYPCPYRVVDVSADLLAIATRHVAAIDYDLQGAADLQTYAYQNLRIGMEALIPKLIVQAKYTITDSQAAEISPWLADGLVAHYAGDEVMPASVPNEVGTLVTSGISVELLAGVMLQSIWTDLPPADNTVTLNLAAR